MENEKSELTLSNRSQLNLSGIKKIKSSEPTQVVLLLDNSALVITGTNLFVLNASMQTGNVEISGQINALKYTGVAMKKKFSFKNLFR